MSTTPTNKPTTKPRETKKKAQYFATPFKEYMRVLDEIDKGKRNNHEFGSILLLTLLEELGEMARAYLAEHGRKKTNLSAQSDESVEQELVDILVSILRYARIKKINLHDRVMYSLNKIKARREKPKGS
jgi:NTP pyrophosphatase (non-canonical NTP hydrolase)